MGWKEILRWPSSPEAKVIATGVADARAESEASADPDWVLAKSYIRERLVALRRNLESVGLSIERTEGLRTAILELEGVLNFRKPSKMSENASE